jgi:hypothetical protein
VRRIHLGKGKGGHEKGEQHEIKHSIKEHINKEYFIGSLYEDTQVIFKKQDA